MKLQDPDCRERSPFALVISAPGSECETIAGVGGEISIGVDVGGTKVAAVRLEGDVIAERVVEPTERTSGEALIAQIAAIANSLMTDAVAGVGVGIASEVEWETGRVLGSVNIPLADIAVREVLAERTGRPVFIDNDGIAAAVGEAWRDGGPAGSLVMITIGTGVGGGVIIDGRPFRGATGAAGHLGHTIVFADPTAHLEPTVFPRPDSLEAHAAGSALDRMAREAAASEGGELARRLGSDGEVSGRDVVEAAREGDPVAMSVLRRFACALAPGVANAIHAFDPDEVVIGGGVSAAGDLLLSELKEQVGPLILPGVGTRTEIRIARLGPDVGVIGAALLVRLPGPKGN